MTDLGLPQYPPVVTESPFIDVPDGAYYLNALLTLQSKDMIAPGLIQNNADGTASFLPEQNALRREVAQSLAPLFTALPNMPILWDRA